jgi:hypothetical protein
VTAHPVSILAIFICLIPFFFSCLIDSNFYNIPMSRRFLEIMKNNVGPVLYNYPIGECKKYNLIFFQTEK